MSTSKILVEVAYAKPDEQKVIGIEVSVGSNPLDAIDKSKIKDRFPEIDLATAKIGIFGKALPKPAEYELRAGDRIEIYRPLKIDPKQARLNRAKKTVK